MNKDDAYKVKEDGTTEGLFNHTQIYKLLCFAKEMKEAEQWYEDLSDVCHEWQVPPVLQRGIEFTIKEKRNQIIETLYLICDDVKDNFHENENNK